MKTVKEMIKEYNEYVYDCGKHTYIMTKDELCEFLKDFTLSEVFDLIGESYSFNGCFVPYFRAYYPYYTVDEECKHIVAIDANSIKDYIDFGTERGNI